MSVVYQIWDQLTNHSIVVIWMQFRCHFSANSKVEHWKQYITCSYCS